MGIAKGGIAKGAACQTCGRTRGKRAAEKRKKIADNARMNC
jgi:hypothetical protein